MSAITDAAGQFWFQMLGRGLVRWVGYGHWETLQKTDRLSEGFPWTTVRPPGGNVWVSTDTGLNELLRRGSSLEVGRVIPGASFALAVGPHGELWSGSSEGISRVDPATGTVTKLGGPPVNSIVSPPGEAIWVGTQAGLFTIDDRPGTSPRAVLQGSARMRVVDVASDRHGGVYYLASGRLRHRHRDGNDVAVVGAWPGDAFEPIALGIGDDASIWIGGAGGLYRFTLSEDRVSSFLATATSDTRTNSIVAVMVDHRGWVWVGTALGVSVFDGQRWVSVDGESGLVSDDVNEGGIREDPDGSVWIVTTQGLSHLQDPDWLFVERPITAVISKALLGTTPVTGRTMPYTKDALSLQFGAPGGGGERSFLFRYRLSGVDADWVESSSGSVHYAFVPPGRHVLTVIGTDQLTHRSSPPAGLVVDVGFPWWSQWWSETIWILGSIALIAGAMRLRFRAILARQAELKRLVAQATEQLRYQAAHDSLTGLLNRREVERMLATRLSGGSAGDEMIVALVDIDHFKRVNDDFGHLGGDDVLRAVGRLVSKTLRGGEFAGRYGGEEILLVLDDSDGRGAERVLDLHHAFRGSPFNAAGQAIRVTCSIGLAWAIGGDDWESLIGRADHALYEAKADGRDKVVESGRAESETGVTKIGSTKTERARGRFRPGAP